MSQLGASIRAERKRQGVTLGQLARLVGYRNLAKGTRRLSCLEQTGMARADLLANVVDALSLDWTLVERLAEEDRREGLREWEAWVNEPLPMYLVVRLMAAVSLSRIKRTTPGPWAFAAVIGHGSLPMGEKT
jgi:hypothetical protein